jgi:hypothetical protein
MAVGCSHGHLIDPAAREAVLTFARRWKPDTALHLGDFTDLAAFMSNGNADSKESSSQDFKAGHEFLTEYFEATGAHERHLLLGNHEDQLWKLAASSREVVAWAAKCGISAINDTCKESGAKLLEYDNTKTLTLGNFKFFHGFMFSEQAVRDHAEAFGNCVFAHTHRIGVSKGRRSDNPTGVCVGTLTTIPAMRYAKTNRSRLAWAQGFAFFEYCDKETHVWLVEGPKSDDCGQRSGTWRLPV